MREKKGREKIPKKKKKEEKKKMNTKITRTRTIEKLINNKKKKN